MGVVRPYSGGLNLLWEDCLEWQQRARGYSLLSSPLWDYLIFLHITFVGLFFILWSTAPEFIIVFLSFFLKVSLYFNSADIDCHLFFFFSSPILSLTTYYHLFILFSHGNTSYTFVGYPLFVFHVYYIFYNHLSPLFLFNVTLWFPLVYPPYLSFSTLSLCFSAFPSVLVLLFLSFFECCQSTFTPFCCHITFLDPPESLLWALYVSLCCRSFLWGYTGWVLDSKGRLSLQVSPFSFFSLEITVVFLGLSTPLLALHH